MVALKLGTTDANKVYLGLAPASAVYLGNTKIWPSFVPSGMNKSGTATSKDSYTLITGWAANTAQYPGSTVAANGLVTQSAKVGATLSAHFVWTEGTRENALQFQFRQNGIVVYTMPSGDTASPGDFTATVNLAAGDNITVWCQDTTGESVSRPATFQTSSWVTIT